MTQQEQIHHILHRLGFGWSPDLEKWYKQPRALLIEHLFKTAKKIPEIEVPDYEVYDRATMQSMSKKDKKEVRKEQKQKTALYAQHWIHQMADSKNSSPLLEKMTLFWHGHFACTSKAIWQAATQLPTIRKYALGNFRDLVVAIAKDPSMILYLNNQQNKKGSPNENFARELMELFTLGRDNYTEQDIKEAARAFTGWSISREEQGFVFRKGQHDFGSKTFMGKTGNFEGTDIIDIILEQKQAARYIAGRVYAFFVHKSPNKKHIEELATVFFDADYDIATMMRHLANSDWFYDNTVLGAQIKSPIELLVGLKQGLNLNFIETKSLFFLQKALGQRLFHPPNVAGWAGGRAWIDNTTLLLRLSLVSMVFNRNETEFDLEEKPEEEEDTRKLKNLACTLDIAPLKKMYTTKNNMLNDLAKRFLIMPKSMQKFEQFVQAIDNEEERLERCLMVLLSQPIYQMC